MPADAPYDFQYAMIIWIGRLPRDKPLEVLFYNKERLR